MREMGSYADLTCAMKRREHSKCSKTAQYTIRNTKHRSLHISRDLTTIVATT